MTPPGGKTSKPDLRSRFLLGGGDSERDLSLSFLLLCLSLLLDLLRLSRLCKHNTMYTCHFTTKSWQALAKSNRPVRWYVLTCLPGHVLHLYLARPAEIPADHTQRSQIWGVPVQAKRPLVQLENSVLTRSFMFVILVT